MEISIQMRIFIPPIKLNALNGILFMTHCTISNEKAYVLNTPKQHGSFAFEGGIYHSYESYLTEENIKSIHKLLPNTMGDKK